MRSIFFGAAAAVLLAMPASAMHWVQYAPDTPNQFLDLDSIYTKSSYTYFTWNFGPGDNAPPTQPGGNQIGINCATGETLNFENGQWVAGSVWTHQAWLFRSVCHLEGAYPGSY
jgi:hypothetical protein